MSLVEDGVLRSGEYMLPGRAGVGETVICSPCGGSATIESTETWTFMASGIIFLILSRD